MNIVVSDPKAKRAYSKKVESATPFVGRRIGGEISLDALGLLGYSARITGGSDKDGMPMSDEIKGGMRKKVLVKMGRKGLRRSVMRRGNVVSEDISQLNVAITKYGAKGLDELIGKPEAGSSSEGEAPKEEKKVAAKEGHKKRG